MLVQNDRLLAEQDSANKPHRRGVIVRLLKQNVELRNGPKQALEESAVCCKKLSGS